MNIRNNDAFYQRVVTRANELALQLSAGGPDYTAYTNNGDTTLWTVCKRSGSAKTDISYFVDLTAETCECPCFATHGFCKHILALNVMQETIAEAEAAEAQCAAYEKMMQGCELETTGTDPFAKF